ncbi:hypothetical protein DAPPUDRAFT_109858 [Daphnia pulex]|uniref:Uncharacterized protein n=1 Tax=Daphnia pulex TaxID=6669 RepID=E9H4F0_DAPPU|nr:hypothetical protein DAPPUDRAFT_109858 [Daphnia pulex]|eukprot:EFX73414.1 hypothetical protein DAPPUDRAFT_109858 [Daphnia pulex]
MKLFFPQIEYNKVLSTYDVVIVGVCFHNLRILSLRLSSYTFTAVAIDTCRGRGEREHVAEYEETEVSDYDDLPEKHRGRHQQRECVLDDFSGRVMEREILMWPAVVPMTPESYTLTPNTPDASSEAPMSLRLKKPPKILNRTSAVTGRSTKRYSR